MDVCFNITTICKKSTNRARVIIIGIDVDVDVSGEDVV
jgi:hypothetical protein